MRRISLHTMAFTVFTIALLSATGVVHAKVYKCTTASGKTAFQSTPCKEAGQKSEEVKVKRQRLKPTREATPGSLKMLNYYTSFRRVKPILAACNQAKVASKAELQQAYATYKTVNKRNIDAGKVLFNQGFLDLSAAEIKKESQGQVAAVQALLEQKSKAELGQFCAEQARQLKQAAERVKSGAEGYKPGELDPAGQE